MPRGRDVAIARIAFGQHGLVTRLQLVGVGLSARAIDFQIADGKLVAVHSSVYRLAGVPESWDQTLLAAQLAAGESSVISHLAAGTFWTFDGIETNVPDVLVPHARRLDLRGVRLHRTRLLPVRDIKRRRGLRLTSPARTLLDIAGVVTKIELEVALDDARRRRIVTLEQLRTCLDDRGPNGVKGWRRLDSLITERCGVTPNGSGKETRFRRALIERGLPMPVPQYVITDHAGRFLARVDFAYPQVKIAIQVDSPPHADLLAWEADLVRQNRVNLMRWHFLRFPRVDKRGQREALDTIEAALEAFGEPGRSSTSPELPKHRELPS